MLKRLIIEQFVIIDRLDLEIQSDLTILTGETGAGKSILLGAMGLVLGEESKPESIRQGAEQSVIEALFSPHPDHPALKLLVEHKLIVSSDREFSIRRVVKHEGDDEILLNEKNIDLEFLKELGGFLVEIHGQFANQSLSDPDNQLAWLDLSGEFSPEIFDNVVESLCNVNRYAEELEDEKLFFSMNKNKLREIQRVVEQFEGVGVQEEGFIEEVEEEYSILLTAKETSDVFQEVLGRLVAGNGVVVSLASVNRTLSGNENMDDEKIKELVLFLSDALKNTRAAVDEMNRLAPEYDIDTDPIHECEDILTVLYSISKEKKVEFGNLFDYYMEMSMKLTRLRNGKERIAELEDLLIEAKNSYRHYAHILTEKRIVAGEALSKAITAELPPLKLMKAEFEVKVEEKPEIPWTDLGFNEVTFIARMNPGTPFSPIAETASGGEMARMILALKVILQRVQTTSTLIFDEVDTGIGGPAAAAVGDRIAQLADTTQVLVITHSPQVASRGDQHLHVSKKTDGVTTTSAVRMLSVEERIDEISRMLAGDAVTPESQAAAKSLIDEGAKALDLRRKKAAVDAAEKAAALEFAAAAALEKERAEQAAAEAAASVEVLTEDSSEDKIM